MGISRSSRVETFDARLLAERVGRGFPGLRLEVLEECSSTNTVLAERAKAGAAHGTLLLCEHQSAGRGRRGNAWVSEAGGSVTFSVLWRFPQGAGALAALSLAVAVGAATALEKLGVRGVGVKWPNDLLGDGRKLGGILIETSGNAAGPTVAVVGVGVNLRLSASARRRIGAPVADIAVGCATIPSRTAVAAELAVSVASALERFSREGFAPFRQPWLELHAWQGRRVVLSRDDQAVARGEAMGIAEDGALELVSERGIERFRTGELSLSLEQPLE